jgi:hypothetical protein
MKINSKSSSSNILAMIFKIIPIGLNIIGRLPILAQGTGDAIQGTAQGIAGLSMTSFQLFMDTYKLDLGEGSFKKVITIVIRVLFLHI